MRHPNAAAGAGIPGSVAAILYALRIAGVEVPDPPLEAGVAIGAAISGFALLLGRSGISGIASLLWRGEPDEQD